jgi:alkylhydroperoxidase/carboxymuconolactone decarboxylase family protein YurZ
MTAVDLPIEELRQQLAQIPVPDQSAVRPETFYRELIGFVPPCADTRDTATLESKLRGMHEQVRLRALAPCSIDAKAAHLIFLAMLLKEHGASAVAQGAAARRAGATWDELRGVVRLVFLLHGLPGANRGDEFLTALAEREREDRVAGAVAAYG